MKNIAAAISLDGDKVVYTTGDVVRGVVSLDLPEDFDVRNLNVSLCCDEVGMVRAVIGSIVGDARSIVEQYCHLRRTKDVFPGLQIESMDRPEQLGKKYYKMSKGLHDFNFKFKIPVDSNLPGSIQMGDNTGFARIMWYVKASLRRKDIFGDQVRDLILKIMVIPRHYLPLLEKPVSRVCEHTFYLRLPGISGIANRLMRSELKRHALSVIIISMISGRGILQYPQPLNLRIRLEVPNSEGLFLKECALYLNENMKITPVDGGGGTIVTKRHLINHVTDERRFEAGVCDLTEDFSSATISGLVETFRTKRLTHYYNLLLKLVFSDETRRRSGSVEHSISVHVWGMLSGEQQSNDNSNSHLPRYEEVERRLN